MILQTGQRTDIPAFYPLWLANRIEEGYVMVRNPYQPLSVTKYLINPDVIDGIAFCSKNPRPFFPYLSVLEPYREYWHMTITLYGRDIEPNVPPYEQVLENFIFLSERIGPKAMTWRYDPIIINETYTFDVHVKRFTEMAERLKGHTDTVIVSFIDLYDKVRRNFPQAIRPPVELQRSLITELVQIAKFNHMTLKTCGEGSVFADVGADSTGCLTKEVYEQAFGVTLSLPKRQPSREECNCYLHGDIGAYDSCAHFCQYCYANTNQANVRQAMKLHNPTSPFLIGHALPQDVVKEANQQSWIVEPKPQQDSFQF
jgi:hypothetical protein